MEELHYQIDLLAAMNAKLNSSEKMYRLICDTSNNAFLYYNFEEEHMEMLGAWNSFFDFTVNDLKDFAKFQDCVEEPYKIPIKNVLFAEKIGVERMSHECCLLGGRIWVDVEVTVIYNDFIQPLEKIVRFRNITKFKKQNDELTYLAYYDSITGLFNRNYFVRTLSEWVRNAELKTLISVMFVDIDDFRKINDGLGLIIGDELVQIFGQFLGEFQSEDVIVSHFAGDIFCIAINDPCGTKSVESIYQAINERAQSSFLLSSRNELHISISAGVAEYPEAAKSAIELINCAEIVMFKAKVSGKNTIQYYNSDILNSFLDNINLEHKLKDALIEDSFSLNFQPQFDSKTNKLRGVEALIRLKERDGTQISPTVFIPVAEKNGLIIPIGDWVLEESIRIFEGWRSKYKLPLILSINISTIQYKKADFVTKLLNILAKYNVNPKEIELEITESVLIDEFSDVIEKMRILREYGVRVSLDDFGTGFSSLSYLKGLPIDTLKIDKSFIDTVAFDESSKIITGSIISMVKKLGFETVAEGVETQEQYDYLKEIHCDNIQGYLLGKPMTANDMEGLLVNQNGNI